MREYVAYVNKARPHQGRGQHTPELADVGVSRPERGRTVRIVQVLGGLHHTYQRVPRGVSGGADEPTSQYTQR